MEAVKKDNSYALETTESCSGADYGGTVDFLANTTEVIPFKSDSSRIRKHSLIPELLPREISDQFSYDSCHFISCHVMSFGVVTYLAKLIMAMFLTFSS